MKKNFVRLHLSADAVLVERARKMGFNLTRLLEIKIQEVTGIEKKRVVDITPLHNGPARANKPVETVTYKDAEGYRID